MTPYLPVKGVGLLLFLSLKKLTLRQLFGNDHRHWNIPKAPEVRHDLTTFRLTGECTTYCATQEYVARFLTTYLRNVKKGGNRI